MFFREKPYGIWSDKSGGWLFDGSGRVIQVWGVDAAVAQMNYCKIKYPDARAVRFD